MIRPGTRFDLQYFSCREALSILSVHQSKVVKPTATKYIMQLADLKLHICTYIQVSLNKNLLNDDSYRFELRRSKRTSLASSVWRKCTPVIRLRKSKLIVVDTLKMSRMKKSTKKNWPMVFVTVLPLCRSTRKHWMKWNTRAKSAFRSSDSQTATWSVPLVLFIDWRTIVNFD